MYCKTFTVAFTFKNYYIIYIENLEKDSLLLGLSSSKRIYIYIYKPQKLSKSRQSTIINIQLTNSLSIQKLWFQ